MDCRDCDIPDVGCHEQCRNQPKEEENKCRGCFGASFLDCSECEERNEEKDDEK